MSVISIVDIFLCENLEHGKNIKSSYIEQINFLIIIISLSFVLFYYFCRKFQLMKIGNTLKHLREKNGLTQQEMADIIHTHRSGYSKIENNQQEIPVDSLVLLSKHFGMSVDDLIFFDEKNGVPGEVTVKDNDTLEQLQLINELDTEEKSILLRLIETFVSKKRFKDYVQQNIAAL